MPIGNLKIRERKLLRKEGRLEKKKRKRPVLDNDNHNDVDATEEQIVVVDKKRNESTLNTTSTNKKVKKIKNTTMKPIEMEKEEQVVDSGGKKLLVKDSYEHFDSATAAALRQDDEEILALEAKLGGKKEKQRLYKEYAKLEGFGNEFGTFLDCLDTLVDNVANTTGKKKQQVSESEPYQPILFESDDDIVDFLNSSNSDEEDDDSDSDDIGDEESGDEEIVPMKKATSSFESEEDANIMDVGIDSSEYIDYDDDDDDDEDDDEDNDSEQDTMDPVPTENTFHPSPGEDIYGKVVRGSKIDNKVGSYTPPHLRDTENKRNFDTIDESTILMIQRTLNSNLNRLSDDSIVPITLSIAELYSTYSIADVSFNIWKNATNACISSTYIMTSLIPLYVCVVAGVHFNRGDSAQLGSYILEKCVIDLMKHLHTIREQTGTTTTTTTADGDIIDDNNLSSNKEAPNLTLFLCYLYNYRVLHCAFIYDMIRNLLTSFTEMDIELLLLILSHCGRSLRSDDPNALKEIVLLVQKKAHEVTEQKHSSRVDYMLNAIMDLKNNKRRKTDESIMDKIQHLRKRLNQIKMKNSVFNNATSELSAKLTIDDILNAETKGRWWKVGASWNGNLVGSNDELNKNNNTLKQQQAMATTNVGVDDSDNNELTKLAAKLRMNTDVRRSIFFIVMGSTDYEDCFEKLVRGGLLKNRTERDVIRVIIECCGNEGTYNKFYSHLTARICEYQSQCKFSLQLAFWDYIKLLDKSSARKAANVAKLLSNMILIHNCLKMNVLKVIDMSAPEELHENALIFLTVFFSDLLEQCHNLSDLERLFELDKENKKRKNGKNDDDDDNFDDINFDDHYDNDHKNDRESLLANITVFLEQVMKASPKYKKGSKFRVNLKAAIKLCDPDPFL